MSDANSSSLSRKLRIAVLGSSNVGKSAITVRYLTKRFITEYQKHTEILYSQRVKLDKTTAWDLEILDSSNCIIWVTGRSMTWRGGTQPSGTGSIVSWRKTRGGCLNEHIMWGDLFIVVYSICDKYSFMAAEDYLEELRRNKGSSIYHVLLLGNCLDLDQTRKVNQKSGQALSLKYSCLFYEVSAAECVTSVSMAINALLRAAKPSSVQRGQTEPMRRKSGGNSVSKVLGNILGKKRPSLSI